MWKSLILGKKLRGNPMSYINKRCFKYIFILQFFYVFTFCADYINVGLSYNSGSFVSYFANVNFLYLSAINAINSVDVFEIYDTYTSSVVYRAKDTVTIAVSGTKIQVGSIGSYTGPLILRPLTNTTTIYVRLSKNNSTWKTYRGYVKFSVSGSYFKIINTVDLEEYLYGVLPSEIGAWANMEAQKAQAVAARTFAKKNVTRHSSEGYNLCDTEHCQVYGGKNVESYTARQAVISTKGEVMKYNGELIYTYYFSCCGGITANCSDVWGGSYPYLVSVVDDPDEVYDTNDTDDYCYNDSNYYWTYTISHTNLETVLKSNINTRPTDPLSSLAENGISTVTVDVSGRVTRFSIQYINPNETKTVSGTTFRAVVGNSNLKSTKLLSISYNSGTKEYTFSGKGSGHGVGMCQAGADTMGRNGFSYKQILQHFYKGVVIDDVSPPVITHTPPNEAIVNSSITITAYVTDSNGVSSVKVFYRTSGQQSYYFQNMVLTSGNYYSATIPANIVQPSGVEYYIEAVDTNGNISYFASSGQPQYIPVVVTDTSPPTVSHTPLSSLVEGTTVTISCTVTDATGVSEVKLYYKNSLMTTYSNLTMQKSNTDLYTVEVLGKDVVLGEFKYYISAKDVYNNISYYGTQSSPVVVNVISSDTEGPQVVFSPPSFLDYRMPLEFVLEAQDVSGIKSIILYYKNEDETTYKQTSFVYVQDNYYRAEIPQNDVNISVSSPTLKYFIIATDNRNNSTVIPQNAPQETYKVVIILPKEDKTSLGDKLLVFKSQNAVLKFVLNQSSSSYKPKLNFIIFDMYGKTVKNVTSWDKVVTVDNVCEIQWDGRDNEGKKLPSGMYFYRLEINDRLIKSGKIVVVR